LKSSVMSFVIGPEDAGSRLDVFLSRVVPGVTRSYLKTLNQNGGIRVNGLVEKAGYRLRVADRVDIAVSNAESPMPQPEAIPLTVLYEDRDLAVVDKPAGMVVHPGAGNTRNTLVNALLARFPGLSDQGGLERPGIVHRLDKLTSGLVVVARTNDAHHRLSASFRKREVQKAYLAGVHGLPSGDRGEISLSIGRHPRARTRMTTRTTGGRAAHSRYRVLERGRAFSLLEVEISTGRTHQVRVHLSALGHPIVGDPTYGARHHQALVRRFGDPERYFLHATRLGFPHPVTGDDLKFESPLPDELLELWERLKSAR
jgi:23S rRNA pseudouridine1911/1915/1917 synthase